MSTPFEIHSGLQAVKGIGPWRSAQFDQVIPIAIEY